MLHLVGRRPLCNACISFWWDVPLLVSGSLSWFSLLTRLIDISSLLHISLNAEISTLRRWSNAAFVVFRASKRDWLSVRTVMLVCFGDFASSSVKFDRNIAESQASDMASVSTARVERTTRGNLVEFHERGTTLLYLLFKKMIYPPWLPPSGRLLKLASQRQL